MLGGEGGKERVKWEFGRVSFDGRGDGGKVPICKHLLACLLQRGGRLCWGVFKEMVLGREEMAVLGPKVRCYCWY